MKSVQSSSFCVSKQTNGDEKHDLLVGGKKAVTFYDVRLSHLNRDYLLMHFFTNKIQRPMFSEEMQALVLGFWSQ